MRKPQIAMMAALTAAFLALTAGFLPAAGNTAAPRLKVSPNGRFLVYADGRPFFWLGDTAWELFHRLNREEADRYLENRARKGFTVIQAVAIAELDGHTVANAYGHLPLENLDPARPAVKDGPANDYWDHVDYIVNKAQSLGMFIGFLPTWGRYWHDKVKDNQPLFTPRNAEVYGQWLGRRYRDKAVIWILGGDRPIDNPAQMEIIRALARGLRKGDGGAHLITFHPSGGNGSSTWLHDERWLDFNMRQNGHVKEFTGRYDKTREDYDRIPVKPVLDGEPLYEDHPISFNAKQLGHSLAADVRRPLYWDLFNGACGHTYGHHSVWQMWAPGRVPINGPLMTWQEAIDQPGAGQMQYARRLIESRPFLTRVPDDSLIVPAEPATSIPGAGLNRMAATRDEACTYMLVYTPAGRPFRVRTGKLSGDKFRAWWFDPRDGKTQLIGEFPKTETRSFTPPMPGEQMDWVLVVDDAARDYPPPGQMGEKRQAVVEPRSALGVQKPHFATIALAGAMAKFCQTNTALSEDARPANGDRRVNYARPCEPAIKPAFLPLPPGAVQPAGWLRDWAQSARDGITGHLDEWHATFADGWKGVPVQSPGARPDGTGWPIEQSAYWLDGALRLGFVLHDEALIKKIRARLDPVVEGVHKADFGTSLIYWKKGFKPVEFDSWAHSQLGRALVALYQGTGDKRVLDALVKVYADYPVKMGNLNLGGGGVSGLCNLDPMLETYSYSGDRRILERALKAIAQADVAGEIEGWPAGRLSPGHIVIFYENIRLPSVVYPWSGNQKHLQATLGAFRWLDENHTLPYGVASGEEFASGVGAFRKTETCDVTAMLLACSWMYRIQGRGDWGDRMERAFFNAAAAPVARDFQTVCYYQSPNRLGARALPCEQPNCPGPEGVRFHRLGCPTVLCCVGAVNRIIPNYIIHLWMATRDNGLAATLYGPCTVSALVGAGIPVQVTAATDYPFGETIRLNVAPERDVAFPLYLRIPQWCKEARITVNGTRVQARADDRGFAKVVRTWGKNDTVELRFPMQPQVVRGYETEFPAVNRKYFSFEADSLFQRRRLPYASVLYGPLLFSLPIPDVDPNTPDKSAKWQYALDTDAMQRGGDIRVTRQPMPAHWDWPLMGPITLHVPAMAFDWQPTDAQALPDKPVAGTSSATIGLVPYGCTKFRISMFPVTSRAWGPDAR